MDAREQERKAGKRNEGGGESREMEEEPGDTDNGQGDRSQATQATQATHHPLHLQPAPSVLGYKVSWGVLASFL